MRLTKQILEEQAKLMTNELGTNVVVGYWNELVHLYDKETGEMFITGTLRECYNYTLAYLEGYRRAKFDNK